MALVLARQGKIAAWRWPTIAGLTMFAGVAYTAFSEWLNTRILGSWQYAVALYVGRKRA